MTRREKEERWQEHLKEALPPEKYRAYLAQREQRRKKQMRLAAGAVLAAAVCVIGISTVLFRRQDIPAVKNGIAETETEAAQVYPERDITIGSTGSMLLHSPFINSYPDAAGNYDFSSIFTYIAPYYSAPDWMTCEFEGTLSGPEAGYSGYPNFKSPDAIVENLRDSGVDLFMLATNHAYDGLSDSFHRTMEVCAQKQIPFTGMHMENQKPYYIAEVQDVSIGFLDYVYETKGAGVDLNGIPLSEEDGRLVNSFDYDDLESFYREVSEYISQMKEAGARFIVANLHWGTEYHLEESDEQRQIAQRLCDLGVDALIGGHPHCLQPIDVFESADGSRKMFCIFSVGNALCNQRTYLMEEMPTGHTEDGVMVTLSLHQNPGGEVRITGVELLPTWVYRFQNNGSKYYILPLDNVAGLPGKTGIADLGEDPQNSYNRTMEVLGAGLEKAQRMFQPEKA